MSKRFLKLYREVDTKSSLDSTGNALQERKHVLNVLGYNTGFKEIITAPHKHHGRAARRRKAAIRDERLPKITHPSAVSNSRLLNASPEQYPEIRAPIPQPDRSDRCVVKYFPTNTSYVRERLCVDKSQSRYKWTSAERDKLEEIYRSMEEPEYRGMLLDFYKIVASRHVLFFPQRNVSEIVERLKLVQRTNQIKRPGEPEYWRSTRTS